MAIFVWEKDTMAWSEGKYRPARYAVPPSSGTGQTPREFAFKKELTDEEAKEPIIMLINRYPCPKV